MVAYLLSTLTLFISLLAFLLLRALLVNTFGTHTTLLELVRNLHHNFEGDDAEKEGRLYRERVKEKLRRSCKRTTLSNFDNTLHHQQNPDAEMDDVDVAEDGMMVSEEVGDIDETDYHRTHWKIDVGERARRVYEWWTTAMKERSDTGPCCFKAVKLIALSHTSSAGRSCLLPAYFHPQSCW